MNKQVIVVIVLAIVAITSPVSGGAVAPSAENQCGSGVTKTIHHSSPEFGEEMVYNFTLDESHQWLCVTVENLGQNPDDARYSVIVDNHGLEFPEPELEPGASTSYVHNISSWLNLFEDNHTVQFGAKGNHTRLNFTKTLNESSSDIPSPEINNVNVIRDEQNDSTALQVTLYNPTKRGYITYVQAETLGTDGVHGGDAPQPNQTEQVILPLRESPDEVIAGKVRIFHKWGVSNGMYDQKEFMSRPNETVNAWDVAFTRVPGTVDTYNYHNESAARYREGYIDDDALPPLQKKIGAALVAVLSAVALWRRRKHR